jgi:hypothetical protein
MRGKFLWKMLHFDHGYITCLYVPIHLVGDACAQIVAILLVYVSLLSCCSSLCIFEKHILAFVDLIHALSTTGRKLPNSCFHGEFCMKGRTIGSICSGGACIHAFGSICSGGSLHSCIWELFSAWILVVPFCRWCRALLTHLEESAILEHFILVVLRCCPGLMGHIFL